MQMRTLVILRTIGREPTATVTSGENQLAEEWWQLSGDGTVTQWLVLAWQWCRPGFHITTCWHTSRKECFTHLLLMMPNKETMTHQSKDTVKGQLGEPMSLLKLLTGT